MTNEMNVTSLCHNVDYCFIALVEPDAYLFTASINVVTNFDLFCRDGGLKRGKVKDTFKEEQQKLYSKMLVGTQEDRSRS